MVLKMPAMIEKLPALDTHLEDWLSQVSLSLAIHWFLFVTASPSPFVSAQIEVRVNAAAKELCESLFEVLSP